MRSAIVLVFGRFYSADSDVAAATAATAALARFFSIFVWILYLSYFSRSDDDFPSFAHIFVFQCVSMRIAFVTESALFMCDEITNNKDKRCTEQ